MTKPKPSAATLRCIELVRQFGREFTQDEYETACKYAGITCIRPETLEMHGAIDIIPHKKAIHKWSPREFLDYLRDEVFGEDCYMWVPDIEWDECRGQYLQYETTHYTYTAR